MGPAGGTEPDGGVGLDEQALEALRSQIRPNFDSCEFECYVKSARIDPGGELEITLKVPPVFKYHAMPLTDAAGVMVVVSARRKRRTG